MVGHVLFDEAMIIPLRAGQSIEKAVAREGEQSRTYRLPKTCRFLPRLALSGCVDCGRVMHRLTLELVRINVIPEDTYNSGTGFRFTSFSSRLPRPMKTLPDELNYLTSDFSRTLLFMEHCYLGALLILLGIFRRGSGKQAYPKPSRAS